MANLDVRDDSKFDGQTLTRNEMIWQISPKVLVIAAHTYSYQVNQKRSANLSADEQHLHLYDPMK